MNSSLRLRARTAFAFVVALALTAATAEIAGAAGVVAQEAQTTGPLAPGYVFLLLLALLFAAVLVFAFQAFNNARR